MLRIAEGTLVVLVGPSGSGKSTWAAAHFSADEVVSSDRLRGVVGTGEHDLAASADAFAVLDLVVAARVRRGLTTVIDTLGLDGGRRQAWRELAARAGVPCVAVAFDLPAAQCRRQNAAREHRVPAPVLSAQLRTFAQLRPGLEEEGFDEVLAADPVRVVAPAVAAAERELAPGVGAAATRSPAAPGGAADPADPATGSAAPLRFGLQLSSFRVPGGAAGLGPRMGEVAAAAEAAGFSSLWVMDHLRQIPQLGRAWEDLPEAAVTLAHLAAATSRVTVGCLVHCVTYRNVAHLGKIVATLDVLSGGRAVCGLGAGWFEAEHAAYGWPFPPAAERLDLLEDALQLLPLLWGPGAPSFEGRRVRVPEALCYPRPLQPRVPILVGGSGERRTLRLVARYADACNLTGEVPAVRRSLEVLHRHCAEVGRDPATIEVTHLSSVRMLAGRRGPDDREARDGGGRGRRGGVRAVPGTVEDHVLRARALQAAGVQHLIVALDGVWDSPALELFAEVVRELTPPTSA